jgi:hypothetical protein
MFIGNISCTLQQDLFWPYKETCQENLLASTAWFNFNTFWPVHNAHFDEMKGKVKDYSPTIPNGFTNYYFTSD